LPKGDVLKPSLHPAGVAPDGSPLRAPQRTSPALHAATISARGGIEGYASLFGVEDQGRDVVMAGAFRASLLRRPALDVRLLFQHDPAEPIGVWEEIREDARGLHVRGHLVEEVARAREVLALIRAGALDGLSIGFHARKASRDAATGQRRLYEIDLLEISIVTFPMLRGARVNALKTRATAAWSLTRPEPAPLRPHLPGRRDAASLRPSSRAPLERAREARPGEGSSCR
jgi:HK97 family phage prohead protease